MTDRPTPMVMRSVYLPDELDSELRQVAFLVHRAKADLIRSFVTTGLIQLKARLESLTEDISKYPPKERDTLVAELLQETVAQRSVSEERKQAFRADTERVPRRGR